MSATYGTPISSAFGNDFTLNPSLPGLTLALNSVAYLGITLRNQGGVVLDGAPTWNGRDFTLLASLLDHDSDSLLLVYRLAITDAAWVGAGTYSVLLPLTDYGRLSATVIPVTGANAASPERAIFSQVSSLDIDEEPIAWAPPLLEVTDAIENDIILTICGSIGWNDGYDDLSAITYTPNAGQSALLVDQSNSAGGTGGFPRILASSKPGDAGPVEVGYTVSSGTPKYQHVAFAIVSAAPSITSAPTPIRRNSINAVVTANLGTRDTATFGTIPCGISGGNVVVPNWSHGVEDDMDIGDDYNLTLIDTDTAEATVSRPYGLPAGYTHNQIGAGIAVDTGEDSICKDPAIIAGTDVYVPDLGGGTMTNDGNFHGVPFGVYPGFWLRDLDLVMWTFTVTLVATAVPDKYIVQIGGKLREQAAVIESSGVADAGKIPALRGDGTFDPGFLPVIAGVTDGIAAEVGMVGELLSASVAAIDAVSLTSTTAANIVTLNLSAGEWDISGMVAFDADPTTTTDYSKSSISLVSAVHGVIGTYCTQIAVPVSIVDRAETLPTTRIRLTASAPVYLVCQAEFAVSTLAAYGTLRATRVR